MLWPFKGRGSASGKLSVWPLLRRCCDLFGSRVVASAQTGLTSIKKVLWHGRLCSNSDECGVWPLLRRCCDHSPRQEKFPQRVWPLLRRCCDCCRTIPFSLTSVGTSRLTSIKKVLWQECLTLQKVRCIWVDSLTSIKKVLWLWASFPRPFIRSTVWPLLRRCCDG